MRQTWLGQFATGCVLTGAALLAFTAPVAAQPLGATGGFVVDSDTQTVIAQAAGNFVVSEVMTLDYASGPLHGSAVDSDTFLVHADGSFEGQGVEVCDGCTVDESTPGDFMAVFRFGGAGDSYSGQLEVISTSGGLSGLRGGGSFAGTISTNVNTYDYHFTLQSRP